ncbi:MAG: DNA-directed RNA polymerase subunit alpha C-terminal domain-containing protein [Methylobacter sp.]
MAIGEAETIPLFVALNGWGYEASAEEIGLVNSTTDGQVSAFATEHTELVGEQEQTPEIDPVLLRSVDELKLPVRAANCLREKGIFRISDLIQCTESDLYNLPNFGRQSLQDINRALSSINLPTINSGHASIDELAVFIRCAPSWLLTVPLDSLGFQVRTFNALKLKGFNVVGDIASFSSQMLLEIPNFGRTSLHDLSLRLKSAIERGPALSISSQTYVDAEDNAASPILNNAAIRLGSQFKNLDSLASIIVAAVSSLPSNKEKAVRARMGLGSESLTLQEIGGDMGVTRERVRQLEASGMSKIGSDSVWKYVLEAKLAKLLDERDDPLPFYGLPILDDWFCGIEKMEEPFCYLLEHKNILDCEFSLLKANGQLFVSRLSQDEWNKTVKQAMRLLEEGVNHRWDMSEARRCVEDLLGKKGGELRSELWTAAKQFAHFSSPDIDSEPVLLSYGRGAEALVEAVLSESERPLHYSEIPQRIAERYGKEVDVRRVQNAACHTAEDQIVFLYGRGVYGVIKHCPLNHQERAVIREEVLEIIFCGASDRQWSCPELVDILNERGLDFDGSLNIYTLNIALKDSSEINYLGRNIWAQSSSISSGATRRIDIRQAVTSLLIQAGKPMSNSEIKETLRNDRGIGYSFQILPSESIISVGVGQWGLIERDLPLNADEQVQLIDVLQEILRNRNNGIHISEIFLCLEDIFEPISRIKNPEVLFAVAQRSGLMSKSYGDYLYLSEWGEPRRLNSAQAIIEALKKADSTGLRTKEIIQSASAILGRQIQRDCIYGALSAAGARVDESTKRWILPDTKEIEDEETIN